MNEKSGTMLQTTGCINSETIYTPLEPGPKRMSVIGVQHLVLALDNRVDKLGYQLHAAGQKVQAAGRNAQADT